MRATVQRAGPRSRRHGVPGRVRARPFRRRGRTDESGATASLELMALTPLLALLVLLVLWSGRSARAGLIADLAAEEAAVAAALCCDDAPGLPHPLPAALRRELMAEAVLSSRPGLDHLCLRGPQPANGTGFVTEASADLPVAGSPDLVRAARVVDVHLTCETDGVVAPMRGLLPTVTVHGRAAHVVLAGVGPLEKITDAAAGDDTCETDDCPPHQGP